MEVNEFTGYTSLQLKRELSYIRQFAGVKDVSYHRDYCQAIALELRKRNY